MLGNHSKIFTRSRMHIINVPREEINGRVVSYLIPKEIVHERNSKLMNIRRLMVKSVQMLILLIFV